MPLLISFDIAISSSAVAVRGQPRDRVTVCVVRQSPAEVPRLAPSMDSRVQGRQHHASAGVRPRHAVSVRRDPVDVLFRIAEAVHLPLTSRVFDRVLTLAVHASPKKEVGLAMSAFAYAFLMGTEGVGLYLKRPWARWFTLGATSSLIPIEVFEIIRTPRPLRVTILILNLLIVIYLFIRKDAFE
jgi:uncharacterized membrane protein (DUF2068 family)